MKPSTSRPESSIPRLPLPLRLANQIESHTSAFGKRPISLDPESLMTAARNATQLDDFGSDDFREPFERHLEALENEARLSLWGRFMMRREMVRQLSNRLRIQHEITKHPEILDEPIVAPIFIVGFPRTGTTILHHLMALPQGMRAPLLWELMRPAPAPRLETRTTDPRIATSKREVAMREIIAPTFQRIHPLDAERPDECYHLMQNAFRSHIATTSADLPKFAAWLQQQDFTPSYRYHRIQLQLLQWKVPTKRWVLKAPAHFHAIDTLFAVYPDALIVQTHRDLRQVGASFCSLTEMVRTVFSEDVQPEKLGPKWLEVWTQSLNRTLNVRDARNGAGFFDLHYKELMRDPVATTCTLFEKMGVTIDDADRTRMAAFMRDNPQNKHGKHRYELEWYGLDAEQVASHFASYMERFELG